jgi:hypothetical protein
LRLRAASVQAAIRVPGPFRWYERRSPEGFQVINAHFDGDRLHNGGDAHDYQASVSSSLQNAFHSRKRAAINYHSLPSREVWVRLDTPLQQSRANCFNLLRVHRHWAAIAHQSYDTGGLHHQRVLGWADAHKEVPWKERQLDLDAPITPNS